MSERNSHTTKMPPKLAIRFLRWYCRPELVDEVEGDLYELFQRRIETEGLQRARLRYWLNVLMFFHPDYIRRRKYYPNNHTAMLRNYFIIALRSILKQKSYSLLNIIGLSLGLACTFLITLWIQDEMRYDSFHESGDHLYRVMRHVHSDGQI
ncbi:MAG: permease prefix domain 2-containing transporter, partial [Bacteroidota bacterium]